MAALAQHLSAGAAAGASTNRNPPEGQASPPDRLITSAFAAQVAEAHAVNIFDLAAPRVRDFTQKQFDDDGYYSWDGLLTVAGSELVRAACQRVQRLLDEQWVDANWEGILEEVWAAHGFTRPTEFLSEERKAAIRGGNQLGGAPSGRWCRCTRTSRMASPRGPGDAVVRGVQLRERRPGRRVFMVFCDDRTINLVESLHLASRDRNRQLQKSS
jgi:hypothetical protein